MSERLEFRTRSEDETLAVGQTLARRFRTGGVVYLSGDLGVGKTTLVRGLLRALGYDGRVKSPSYGLIESYTIDGLDVHHLDLYRLGDGEEILYLGLEDLLGERSLLLVEWPERGEGWLPAADWTIRMEDDASGDRRFEVRASGRG